MDKRIFCNQPGVYNSQPLWHLNADLSRSEIIRQLRVAKDKSGFGGVAPLPVTETQPAFLSDGYFQHYGQILETCRALGLQTILYDDVNFPSGTAGGRIIEKNPDYVSHYLDMISEDVVGPMAWSCAAPAGKLMACVAMNLDTYERCAIPTAVSTEPITWQVPAGNWRLMVFTCQREENYQGIDYLSPQAVDAFLAATYETYYQRFAPYFGTTIQMSFFDDIHLRYRHCRTWTPGFNDAFCERTGNDPALLYPALWFDIGPETEAARVALFGFRAYLLSENFTRRIAAWAVAHGIQASGHAMEQYAEQPTYMAGDNLLFYKHTGIPMMDSIHFYGRGRAGFKMTSSAACIYDKPFTAVEIYGNYSDTFDTKMLYRSGMELMARGADILLPHGMWYDAEHVRIKPLISDENRAIAEDLNDYNDWVGRCCYLLRGGTPVVDIGVLYPIATLHAFASFGAIVDQRGRPGNVHPGRHVPPRFDLHLLSDQLTGGTRQDFTFLHPDVLDACCHVKGAELHLQTANNHQVYHVLLLPSCRVIHPRTLGKVKQFYDAGGIVIATTDLPAKSAVAGGDPTIAALARHIFGGVEACGDRKDAGLVHNQNASGGHAIFVENFMDAPEALTALLDRVHPVPDVRIENVAPTTEPRQGMLSYLHKTKAGRNIYYFANSTEQDLTPVIQLRGEHQLECWNPHTGETHAIESVVMEKSTQTITRVTLPLPSLQSRFLLDA